MTERERQILEHLIADCGSPHRRIQAARQRGECQGERWATIAQALFAVAKSAAMWLEEDASGKPLAE